MKRNINIFAIKYASTQCNYKLFNIIVDNIIIIVFIINSTDFVSILGKGLLALTICSNKIFKKDLKVSKHSLVISVIMLQFEIHSIYGFNWCKTTFSKIQLFTWILAWKIGILVFPSAKGQKRKIFKNLNCRLLFIPNGFKKSGCPKNMTTSTEIWLSPPTSSYLQTNIFSIATILGLWVLKGFGQ